MGLELPWFLARTSEWSPRGLYPIHLLSNVQKQTHPYTDILDRERE